MSRLALLLALPLLALPGAARAQTMSNPVGCDGCIGNWYYFDANGADAGAQDWSCGSSSYNRHRGSDFSLIGGNGAIGGGHPVVATASGTVVSTLDGNYDACTSCPEAGTSTTCGTSFGFGYGNHVVINHGSYRVIYAHMRNGSIRVGPGDTVSCGDVIGEIASSGCSTGAHLHYETRPLGGSSSSTAFDPFAGSCSATSPSLWTSQGSHRGMPGRECGAAVPTCPSGTYAIWTCNAERTQRRRCIDGDDMIEDCPYGCVSMPTGTDDVCGEAPDADGDGSRADVDCDDGNAGRYPGNTEVCGDGVDQDCDGSDLACAGVDAGTVAPGTDAGTVLPGVDAGPELPGVDGGSLPPGVDAGESGGSLTGSCSCRAGAQEGGGGGGLLGLVALGLVGLRRRR